jgi:Ni,Fe-hydrogenase III component G
MLHSKGYKEVLHPFLLSKLNQSFPDPSQFKSEEEFTYAAKTTSVYKKVISELLVWMDNKESEMEHLLKKEKGELEDNFRIGGDL